MSVGVVLKSSQGGDTIGTVLRAGQLFLSVEEVITDSGGECCHLSLSLPHLCCAVCLPGHHQESCCSVSYTNSM